MWKRKAQEEKTGEETRQWQNSCCHFSRLGPQARLSYIYSGCLCSASKQGLTAGQTASAAPPPHAQGLCPVRHALGPGPRGPSAPGMALFTPWSLPACRTQKWDRSSAPPRLCFYLLLALMTRGTLWSSN